MATAFASATFHASDEDPTGRGRAIVEKSRAEADPAMRAVVDQARRLAERHRILLKGTDDEALKRSAVQALR